MRRGISLSLQSRAAARQCGASGRRRAVLPPGDGHSHGWEAARTPVRTLQGPSQSVQHCWSTSLGPLSEGYCLHSPCVSMVSPLHEKGETTQNSVLPSGSKVLFPVNFLISTSTSDSQLTEVKWPSRLRSPSFSSSSF